MGHEVSANADPLFTLEHRDQGNDYQSYHESRREDFHDSSQLLEKRRRATAIYLKMLLNQH
jgi:hypothetical protein